MQTNDTHTPQEMLDVAIVGGGVSGIYSAWRLIHADANSANGEGVAVLALCVDCELPLPLGKLKIGLFEGSD